MTIVVTRSVPDRYRGFLASCMLELAPGVYASPEMSRAVRDRVWAVCCEWSGLLAKDGGVLIGKVYGDLADEHRKRAADKMRFGIEVLPAPDAQGAQAA